MRSSALQPWKWQLTGIDYSTALSAQMGYIVPYPSRKLILQHTVWYGIVEFNVPLDTVQVISATGALSSDVHLPFSNGGPAT